MKHIAFLTLFSIFLYAQMGDCLRCHPKLLKNIDHDKNHRSMRGCIKCHSASSVDYPKCGNDCFKCHTTEDMDIDEIKEHLAFEECRGCHEIREHELFSPEISPQQSHTESLKEFLF